jgi:hypothetical protein
LSRAGGALSTLGHIASLRARHDGRDARAVPELALQRIRIELASALHRLPSDRFRLEATTGMVGARWVVQAIRDGDDPRTIAARSQPALARFAAICGR